MSLYRKFASDVAIVATANMIVALRGIFLIPIIAKLLGATGYGIWVQVAATLSLLSLVTSLGLLSTFVRFFAGVTDTKQIQKGFFTILITLLLGHVVVAVGLFLLAEPLAGWLFKGAEATDIVRLMAVIFVFFGSDKLMLFFFRTFRRTKIYFVAIILQNFGEVALVTGFILAGGGVFGAVLSLLITRVVVEAALLSAISFQVGIGLPARSDFAKLPAYLRYGVPLIPGALSQWITNLSDRYVIAIILGIASTGIYSAAYGLSQFIRMFLAPLNFVLVPAASQLYDHGRINEVRTHLSYSLKYFLLLAIPAAAGLSVLSRPILAALTTPEFVSGGARLMPILTASMVVLGWYATFAQVINLVKKTTILGSTWAAAAALNLGLNLIVVPRLGILGAALTTLISFTLAALVITAVSFKYLRFTIDWGAIVKILLATAVMTAAISRLHPEGIVNLLIVILAGAVIYFVSIFLLRVLAPQEKRFFAQMLTSMNPLGVNKEVSGVAASPEVTNEPRD